MGRVTIGENVIIGAGCVVTADVPDNATVVSQKPRIITHEEYKKREYLSHEDLVALSQQDHYIKL